MLLDDPRRCCHRRFFIEPLTAGCFTDLVFNIDLDRRSEPEKIGPVLHHLDEPADDLRLSIYATGKQDGPEFGLYRI